MGLPVTYDYMFREQDIEYIETAPFRRVLEERVEMDLDDDKEEGTAVDLYGGSERNHGRNLVSFSKKKTSTFPKRAFPLKITTTVTFTVNAGARLTKKYWRLWGEGWFNWDPCEPQLI